MSLFQKGLVVSLLVLLSACTTTTTIDTAQSSMSPQQWATELKPGNEVRITTVRNEHYHFVIETVSDDRISGENILVPFDEIATLQQEQFSMLKTTGASIGGYVLLSAIVWAIILL